MRYSIKKDIETKNLRKLILKYSKDIPVVEKHHRGVFSITGYRSYNSPTGPFNEIDVVFKGELKATVSILDELKWYGADIKKNENYNISITKVCKILRYGLFNQINSHLAYFSTEIETQNSIKTIKWK
jgi:hypothetical protein